MWGWSCCRDDVTVSLALRSAQPGQLCMMVLAVGHPLRLQYCARYVTYDDDVTPS